MVFAIGENKIRRYLIRQSDNTNERASIGSTCADERGEFALFLATLSFEIPGYLIDEYVQDDDNDKSAPEVRDDKNEAEDFVRGPGDVAVL